MPHQCTNCGRAFPDGSKQMLSGCPDCGGNKFQFRPDGAVDVADERGADPDAGDGTPDARPDVAEDPDATRDVEAAPEPEAVADAPEDSAQADARSDVVSPDELTETGPIGAGGPAGNPPDAEDARTAREPKPGDRPDLSELREALNSQFESIKIVSPGQYELNLMELYDRQEYIISLQEDGRYVIEMPDAWGADADDPEA